MFPGPECNVCLTEHIQEYEGPCTEFHRFATDTEIMAGTARRCPGTVSLVTAFDRVLRERDMEIERLQDQLDSRYRTGSCLAVSSTTDFSC